MKKKLFIALGLAGVIALSISLGVYAASDIKLWINGKAINADIQIVNGSSYVPLRVVSESLGADIKWDGVARTITVVGKVEPLPVDGVYKANDLTFFDVKAENGTYGWDVEAEVKNIGKKNDLTSIFKAVFYGADGKRISTASGSVSGLDVSTTKTVKFITSDDLTGYTTIKFQIDM